MLQVSGMDAPVTSVSRVAILLATYNGQAYLSEQLASYAMQIHRNWVVYASDDGSKDGTRDILRAHAVQWGRERLVFMDGPAKGGATNFLSMACSPDIQADYYAYSDQDDVWEPEKLQRAVHALAAVPEGVPALYCSRLGLVDARGRGLGLSRLFMKPPCFENALVQNIASGNTSVFNQAAKALLQRTGADVGVPFHDWWTYLVVSGCGGWVIYDTQPSILYRQHDRNEMGSNRSFRAKWQRMHMMWRGCFREWNDRNIRALARLDADLTNDCRAVLKTYSSARHASFLPRLHGMLCSGVHFQTAGGNLGLLVAAIFNKI
ncbi:glycosyltransferase family 2 protein [Pigmentiphaga sp. YJ18]|uniref:glycosyltransferase family 2 protein n=1 Tax=Pigmentiphaga sp. YJ18 TaxID=3134907 RepID=UPI0031111ECD